MAIKFACRCGKHLKARESSAGRLTQCPRCGDPVAIPDGRPNHRGTDDLPASLIGPGRTARVRPVERSSPPASVPAATRPAPIRVPPPLAERPLPPSTPATSLPAGLPLDRRPLARSSRRRSIDAGATASAGEIRLRRLPHWWRLCGRQTRQAVTWTVSFGFTLGTFPVLLGLGTLLGISAGVWLRLLPEAMQSRQGPLATNPLFPAAGLACLVLAGYCASVLNRVLAGAARQRGDGAVEFGLDAAFLALAVWIGCFLAGPVVFVTLAWWYWSLCGDLTPLDWMILAEFLVPATGWWLVALTSTRGSGRPLDVVPGRVLAASWRLGSAGVLITLAASFLLAAFLASLFAAARLIHQDDPAGFLLLTGSMAVSVVAAAALLRALGGAYARAGQRSPRSGESRSTRSLSTGRA